MPRYRALISNLYPLDVCSETIIMTSIKDSSAVSFAHGWQCSRKVFNIRKESRNVTSSAAELFAIRYSIAQAETLSYISEIAVVTDSMSSAQKSVNVFNHPSQAHCKRGVQGNKESAWLKLNNQQASA